MATAGFREQAEALAALEAGTLSAPRPRRLPDSVAAGRVAAPQDGGRTCPRGHAHAFADWVKAEAPKRTGPSGVGKDNYNW